MCFEAIPFFKIRDVKAALLIFEKNRFVLLFVLKNQVIFFLAKSTVCNPLSSALVSLWPCL